MNILTTVTEAEAKVVEVVRDLQKPVAGYVQKGVDLAGERLPKITYPSNLPRPGQVLDSQYEFVTKLLSAQYELLKTVGAKVAPLVGVEPTPAEATKAPTATEPTGATTSTTGPKPMAAATSTKVAASTKATTSTKVAPSIKVAPSTKAATSPATTKATKAPTATKGTKAAGSA
jgi:hypothetical protein